MSDAGVERHFAKEEEREVQDPQDLVIEKKGFPISVLVLGSTL
jgi:hypothetical protein